MYIRLQLAAHSLALNIKLLLQIYFYLTRKEIYLTLEYYYENVCEKCREEKSGLVQQYVGNNSMLTSLSNVDYVMVWGVYSGMIFSCLFLHGKGQIAAFNDSVAQSIPYSSAIDYFV